MKSTGMSHEAAVHSLRESTDTGETGHFPSWSPTMFEGSEAQHDTAARLLVRHYLTTPEGRAKLLDSMRLTDHNPIELASRVQRLRVIMRGVRKDAAEDVTGAKQGVQNLLQGIDAMEGELKARGFDMSLPVDTGESFDSGTVTEMQTMPGFGYVRAPGIDCANYAVVKALSPYVEEAAGGLEKSGHPVARLEVTPTHVRAYAKRNDGREPGSEQPGVSVDRYVEVPLPEGSHAKLRGISRLPRVPWPVSTAKGPTARKLDLLDAHLFDTPEAKVVFLNVVDYADVRKYHGGTGTGRLDPCTKADLLRIGFQGNLRASTADDERVRCEVYVSRLIPQGFAHVAEAPENAVHAATLPETLSYPQNLVSLYDVGEVLPSPVKVFTRSLDPSPLATIKNRGPGALLMNEDGQGIILVKVPKNIFVPFVAYENEHAIEERLYAIFDADTVSTGRDSVRVETYQTVFETLQRELPDPITHLYAHKKHLLKLLPHVPTRIAVVASDLIPIGIAYATVSPDLAGGVVRHEDGRTAIYLHVGMSARVTLPE
jgi:hypothetical protein